ncbi:thiamine pyrophosphokinase [Alkalispirochaeta americana]|uniref:Thiamine diphosphokinase n=1 Tax=Alkalispirochaeta americana TaxID=159291 RepID=A0A1N6X4S7_9SPIO|nr:thiamine diphosphokinase [Alkalispirochaeta americana]SIQ97364.1 thiamine pyrophosphokinase [Alkalispirochaeta americana]
MAVQKGLVVTGGDAPQDAVRLGTPSHWRIVAADSGIHHLARYGLQPEVILGDFDSLDATLLEENFPDVPRQVFDRAKDYTDTELALTYFWNRGVTDLTILGGGGGRLDHLLGLRALFDRVPYPQRWITAGEEISVVEGAIRFSSRPGEVISFFPLGAGVCRMRSRGLRWELDGLEWRQGDAGVSNECTGEECALTMVTGRLLMVRALRFPLVL